MYVCTKHRYAIYFSLVFYVLLWFTFFRKIKREGKKSKEDQLVTVLTSAESKKSTKLPSPLHSNVILISLSHCIRINTFRYQFSAFSPITYRKPNFSVSSKEFFIQKWRRKYKKPKNFVTCDVVTLIMVGPTYKNIKKITKY